MHLAVNRSASPSFNLLLVVYLAIALVCLIVMRSRHRPWEHVWAVLGWRGSRPVWFAWAVGIAIVTGAGAALAFRALDPAYLLHPTPGTDQAVYARLGLSAGTVALAFVSEAVFQALGEEVFFRGILGGWLTARLGFQGGNAVQAAVFLLPHLTLLIVSVHLWPLLGFQLAGGWLNGWLRYRSGSILPGWLSHTLVNTMSDVLFMLG